MPAPSTMASARIVRSSTGKGFTGGWPRNRPTAESSTPRAAARISAAAPAQSRPWQRPMPTRQKALARLISCARFSTVARSAAGRHGLAAAEDRCIGQATHQLGRKGKGRLQPLTEAPDPGEPAVDLAPPGAADGNAAVGEKRQRRLLAG